MAFCVCSLYYMSSRSIHVIAWISTLFPFKGEKYSTYGYSTFCLTVHQLIDIWDFSTFWLLWIILLPTFMYKVCVDMFLFLLGGIGRIAGSYSKSVLNLWETVKFFSKVAVPLYILTSDLWKFLFLHILTNAYYPLCFWL